MKGGPLRTKKCNLCRERLKLVEFWYSTRFRTCYKCSQLPREERDHKRRLYVSSKISAKKRGLVHTLKRHEIHLPERCVYFGVKLNYKPKKGKARWNDPSIDRIDPDAGYVVGNVQVISYLANLMKQNADIPTLVRFARGVLKTHGGVRKSK